MYTEIGSSYLAKQKNIMISNVMIYTEMKEKVCHTSKANKSESLTPVIWRLNNAVAFIFHLRWSDSEAKSSRVQEAINQSGFMLNCWGDSVQKRQSGWDIKESVVHLHAAVQYSTFLLAVTMIFSKP